VAAVLAGFVFVVVFSLGTDELLRILKIFPDTGQSISNPLFALATGYRIVFGVLASYVTAWLAPYRPMLHVMIGAMIGLALSILGVIVSWNHPEFGPHWYPVALVVTALPCAWLGGKLREKTS
jgi:hypothetical protein